MCVRKPLRGWGMLAGGHPHYHAEFRQQRLAGNNRGVRRHPSVPTTFLHSDILVFLGGTAVRVDYLHRDLRGRGRRLRAD